MSYDEGIAARVRAALAGRDDVIEKKMFGGLAFLVRGNMCCGVLGTDLVVRVGAANYSAALEEPHAREMDFTGRALKGLVYVDPCGIDADERLRRWLDLGLEFAASLPTRQSGPGARPRQRQTRSGRRQPS